MGGAGSADFRNFPILALRQIRRAGVCGIDRQLSQSIGTDSPIFWILGLSRFDVSPANSPFSRVCAPTTHLTRFSGGRPSRLSNFSESGGLGGLGGYELGGRWGAPVLQISGISSLGFPANPSGRRLRYKSSTFQEYRTTLNRNFCFFGSARCDVSPADSLFSGVCTPTTHLTRFSGVRHPRLKIFSGSGGLGGLGGYDSGG